MLIVLIIHASINTKIYFNNLNYKIKLFFYFAVSCTIDILDTIGLIVLIVLIIHKTQKEFLPSNHLSSKSSSASGSSFIVLIAGVPSGTLPKPYAAWINFCPAAIVAL